MKKIILYERPNDWHARFEGVKGIWERGRTIPEAIGNLIITHARELNFEIEHTNGSQVSKEELPQEIKPGGGP
jgi:predicted RNase H-like HicB family nuclease